MAPFVKTKWWSIKVSLRVFSSNNIKINRRVMLLPPLPNVFVPWEHPSWTCSLMRNHCVRLWLLNIRFCSALSPTIARLIILVIFHHDICSIWFNVTFVKGPGSYRHIYNEKYNDDQLEFRVSKETTIHVWLI